MNALKRSSLMQWLMNRLTYDQKYVVAGVVRGIGFAILWWTLYQLMSAESASLHDRFQLNQSFNSWRSLYETTVRYVLLADLYREGQQDLEEKLLQSEERIEEQIRSLAPLPPVESGLELERVREELVQQWSAAELDRFERGGGEVEDRLKFLEELREAMAERTSASLPGASALQAGYLLLEELIQRVGEVQLEAEAVGHALKWGGGRELEGAVLSLGTDIPLIRREAAKGLEILSRSGYGAESGRQVNRLVQEYTNSLDQFLSQASLGRFSDFAFNHLAQLSFSLREAVAREIDRALLERREEVRTRNYWVFGISLVLIIVGCYLGLQFVYEAIKCFINLAAGTKKLTSGDLTVRVPLVYQDEIGAATRAFNHMADNFEHLITQQRRLFEATKQLVGGDFSARVKIEGGQDEEIIRASLSFNKMAQSFEEMMSHLYRLGINLAVSTRDIQEASEKQEQLILEQEETARAILGTAGRISSSAEEFADTVCKVSEVAEKTSKLASKGQDSLINMEVTMRQMVDASGHLSEILFILNQKARRITRVVTTIAKVADQTNLLSLNASIEAETTGSFKARFLKIADEIRRLADQTAIATLEIEKVIREIMSAVSSCVSGVQEFNDVIHTGAKKVGEVGEQMGKIIVQVQAVAFRFESVNEGMQKQKLQAKSIDEGMDVLSRSTRMTSESLASFRTTIETLSIAAEELKRAFVAIKYD